MRTHTLVVRQRLDRPRAEVFGFFAEARNLETITPPWLRFRVLNRGRIEMRRGARIDYRLRLHGVGFAWQSEIAEWDPPLRFVDVQTKGPYRLWRHEHRFEEEGGGTLITDEVTYAHRAPGFVHRRFIEPSLREIFAYRTARIAQLLGGGKRGASAPG